jgi:glycosyltransferase involved in cell wall biosynthesis
MAPAGLAQSHTGGGWRVTQPHHLLHAFSTFAVGGQQTRFVSLANALGDRYRHTILAMDGNYEAASGLDPNVQCSIRRMPVVKSGGISVANLRNMRAMLRQVRPDLLCTYNWGAIEWAMANWLFPVCPQIHIEDGFGPQESPDRQHRRRTLMRRVALSRCARVIVPSSVLADVATRKWGLPSSQVLYLPNGIDCERFSRAPDADVLTKFGIMPDDLLIGTVSALRPEKNLDRLLRLFAVLPEELKAKLAIVGDGPQRKDLERTASDLGISGRVVMAGTMANPECILGRFDIFALSSDTEQMPNSVLEAMAAGLPVFATDVGDVKRMVAADNAPFIIPMTDMNALGQGLIALVRNRALRERLGKENGIRVRAEYGLDMMVARYDALFAASGQAKAPN